jgi:ATP-dependent protease ClpP protease subunit
VSKRNWYSIRAEGAGPAVIYMYGPIGYDWWTDSGTSAKEFARELDALGTLDVELRVNSEGGDVFEGYAIYSAIKRYKGRVTAFVDGLAASAAAYLILAADEVVMGEASCLFIHQAWALAVGNADELRTTAEQLEVLDEQIVGIYAAHSDRDEDEIRATLKATKMFSAAEAVEWGFASRIDEGLKAAARITRPAAKFLFANEVPDGIEVVDEVEAPASDAPVIIDETPDEAPVAEADEQEPVAEMEPQERPVARVVALRGRAQKFDTKG